MDYKKEYKEALERAREYHKVDKDNTLKIYAKGTMEYLFPVLKESEDEKIRKRLIEEMRHFQREAAKESCDADFDFAKSAIAWLEKQGRYKFEHGDDNATKVYKNEDGTKKEPKFKVGDWVVFNNKHQSIYQVEKIENGYYILRHTHGGTFRVCVLHDESLRLWTIQDAKDGDVLQLGVVTAIFKEYSYSGDETCICYCSVCKGEFEIPVNDGFDNVYGCYDTYPATKEQRDLLFQKMKEAGYEWDAEKKELKKISQEYPLTPDECINPAWTWSKEDEISLGDALWAIEQARTIAKDENDMGNLWYAEKWLKSLKERVQPQPKQKWSDENKNIIDSIIEYLECFNDYDCGDEPYEEYCERFEKYIKFMESLKPQSQWKPSKEQMKGIDCAIKTLRHQLNVEDKRLNSLYEQLKKL